MIFKLRWVALCVLVCVASAQTMEPQRAGRLVIWELPLLINSTDHLPKGSVPQNMVANLCVSDVTVVLDQTNLAELAEHFGSTIGQRGDAADSLGWLCFHGRVGQGRRWVLWLMSSEINGPAVGGFQWRLISSAAQVDQRCRTLPTEKSSIQLPIEIRIGMTRGELLRVLGQPTRTRNETLLYFHEKERLLRSQPATEMNLLSVLVRDGTVWAIEVWKSTVS